MSKKRKKIELDEEAAREERILDNFKAHGRLPTPPPGHFHDTGAKQQVRKRRHVEKHRLRDLADRHNRGDDES